MQELSLNWSVEDSVFGVQQKYITALKTNIDNRFSKSLPILTAFGMFNPEAVPLPTSTNFINYGEIHLDVLVNHFFPDDTESKQKVGGSGKISNPRLYPGEMK